MSVTVSWLNHSNDFQIGDREKAQMDQCMDWWDRQKDDHDVLQTLSRNEDMAYADQLKHLEVWQATFGCGYY